MFGKKQSELKKLRQENALLKARFQAEGTARRQWENLLSYAGRAQPDNLERKGADTDEP